MKPGVIATVLWFFLSAAGVVATDAATVETNVDGSVSEFTVEAAYRYADIGDLGGLREYITHGGNPNGSPSHSLLLAAARKQFVDGIKVLVEAGAEVNTIEQDNWSALTFCSYHGNVPCLEFLIGRGANPTIVAKRAQLLPYSFAKNNNHGEAAKLLADYTARFALQNNMPNVLVRLAREQFAELRIRTSRGFTPLLVQCANGLLDNIKEMVKHGADFNEKEQDGWSCLTFAAFNGQMDIVRYLLTLPNIDIGNSVEKAAAAKQQDAHDVIEAFQNARDYKKHQAAAAAAAPAEPRVNTAAAEKVDAEKAAAEKAAAEKAAAEKAAAEKAAAEKAAAEKAAAEKAAAEKAAAEKAAAEKAAAEKAAAEKAAAEKAAAEKAAAEKAAAEKAAAEAAAAALAKAQQPKDTVTPGSAAGASAGSSSRSTNAEDLKAAKASSAAGGARKTSGTGGSAGASAEAKPKKSLLGWLFGRT